MSQRTIFHVDLDCFFVAAERLKDPSLRGIPVAVGGTGPRAVLSAASYEARSFGVHSALPTSIALDRCPQLKIVRPNFALYSELSEKVFEILNKYSPILEQVSVDEAYLDMTGTGELFGPPETCARRIQKEIFDSTGLQISIGIASNKLVAKVATDFCKPNGICFVKPNTEAEFLAPLAVGKLPFCGKATLRWLEMREIKTIAQLQRFPKKILEDKLGAHGIYLHEASFGRGSTLFNSEAETKSISRETTFDRDLCDIEKFKKVIWELTEDLTSELRRTNQATKTIRLKLRYPPFQTITRSRTIATTTNDSTLLFKEAFQLFAENWEYPNPVRLIGIGFVVADFPQQMDLFSIPHISADEDDTKLTTNRLDAVRDEIRLKFGENSIKLGRDLL